LLPHEEREKARTSGKGRKRAVSGLKRGLANAGKREKGKGLRDEKGENNSLFVELALLTRGGNSRTEVSHSDWTVHRKKLYLRRKKITEGRDVRNILNWETRFYRG